MIKINVPTILGPRAHGLMTFIVVMRANGVSEHENCCILQSKNSNFSEYSVGTSRADDIYCSYVSERSERA